MTETKIVADSRGLRDSYRSWIIGLISFFCWVLASPWIVGSQLKIEANGIEPGPVLSWSRLGESDRSGSYGLFQFEPDDLLVFELNAAPQAPQEPIEFWLYYVKSDDPEKYDLEGLLDHGRYPGWEPFYQGEGIVYRGYGPARLELPKIRGNVVIGYGRTPRSGDVAVIRGGMRTDLRARQDRQDSEILVLAVSSIHGRVGTFGWELPRSNIERLRLDVTAKPGVEFSVADIRCVKSFGPFELMDNVVHVRPDEGVQSRADGEWVSADGSASFELEIRSGASWIIHLCGIAITFLLIRIGYGLTGHIRAFQFDRISQSRLPEALVFVVLFVVHGLIASNLPVFVSGDGIDYLNGADGLTNGSDFSRLADYKVPGLSFILAGLMRISEDPIAGFGWFNAVIAVLNGVLSCLAVRSRAGRWWGLMAALLVGLHPTLITYQTWLLREVPAALIMNLLFIGIITVPFLAGRGRKSLVGAAIAFGVICACGAYIRENFALLIFIVPVAAALSLRDGWRTRIVFASVILLTSIALVYPRVALIHRKYGVWSTVAPKLAWNQLLSSWQNRSYTGNDIRVFEFHEWNSLVSNSLRQPLSDYEFSTRVLNGYRSRAGIRDESPEEIAKNIRSIVRDMRDIEHSSLSQSAALSFVNQLGLWNIQAGSQRLQAASAEYYSTVLRGERVWWPDNFAEDARAALHTPQSQPFKARLESLMLQSKRSHRWLEDSVFGNFFNEMFYAFRAVRPVVALLFLAGVVIAIRKRDIPILVTHSIVLAFIVSTALGTGALADRFAVPFIPVMWCCALISLCNLTASASAVSTER